MKQCFTKLGLDETATKEQVIEAYARKKALYSGGTFDEDPKYVKLKLAELEQALREAYILVAPATHGNAEEEQLEMLRQILSEDELHMQELYHKHLTGRVNRAAGTLHKKRTAAQKRTDAAYKGSVILFWLGVAAVIVFIGWLI